MRVGFWNVAGLRNKDEEFWNGLKNWDLVTLTETWTEEKEWSKIKERLPGGYVWDLQEARRRNKKGRVMGGIVIEGLIIGRVKWRERDEG